MGGRNDHWKGKEACGIGRGGGGSISSRGCKHCHRIQSGVCTHKLKPHNDMSKKLKKGKKGKERNTFTHVLKASEVCIDKRALSTSSSESHTRSTSTVLFISHASALVFVLQFCCLSRSFSILVIEWAYRSKKETNKSQKLNHFHHYITKKVNGQAPRSASPYWRTLRPGATNNQHMTQQETFKKIKSNFPSCIHSAKRELQSLHLDQNNCRPNKKGHHFLLTRPGPSNRPLAGILEITTLTVVNDKEKDSRPMSLSLCSADTARTGVPSMATALTRHTALTSSLAARHTPPYTHTCKNVKKHARVFFSAITSSPMSQKPETAAARFSTKGPHPQSP